MPDNVRNSTQQPIPMLGLRSRAEPGQAKVHHSVKIDNFVLGKNGSLKKRSGLKKVTGSKILAPSYLLNGWKSSWLRLRTNDMTWPSRVRYDGNYAVTFRARIEDTKDSAPSASKEVINWSDTGSSGPWYPQELFEDAVSSSFVAGPIICLAATTDPYHCGQTAADGQAESTGWVACAVQDAESAKWYPVLLIFTIDAYTTTRTYAILGSDDYDPFSEHTYTIGVDCDSYTPTTDSVYFRVDDFDPGADADQHYHYERGIDGALETYLNIEDHPVFFGAAPDIDHYLDKDLETPEEWNPALWEFGPSRRNRMTNLLKCHLPAHMSIADIAVWDITAEDADFGAFFTWFTGESYDSIRIDRSDSGTSLRLLSLWPLNENRGLPVEDASSPEDLLDVLSSSPVRASSEWASGVDALRFGGVAPLLIPNGDLYRQQFGGIRGKYGCLYPRDQESFFIYWKPLSLRNPDDQTIAAFVSPQNIPDGLADEKTWLTAGCRGYADCGAIHWGLKLFVDTTQLLGGNADDVYLVFFARGREFDTDDTVDDGIKQCNTAVYAIGSGEYIKLGALADVIGTRYAFGYNRVSSFSEADKVYDSSTVSMSAWNVDSTTVVGTASIDLGSSGAAHYIHENDSGTDETAYDPVTNNYGTGKSLIPTWMVRHMGLKKYYLLVGGMIQPGWSGPEDITDIRERLSDWGGAIERVTYRNEEIDHDGHFPTSATGLGKADVIAGQPADQESWIGIPEQAGGLHSYRFTPEMADDPKAISIGTADRSRIFNVSKRTAGSATITFDGSPASCEIELGPPGKTRFIIISGATSAADMYDKISYLRLGLCSVIRTGNDLVFKPETITSYDSGNVLGTSAGSDSENWIFSVTNTTNVSVTQDVAGYFNAGTFDPHFKMRHTVVGAVGDCGGFGYLGAPLSDDDMEALATQGHIDKTIKTRFKGSALSLWDLQESSGGRLLDSAGDNTIWDSDLFPITACPKTLLKNAGQDSDIIELDIHHSIPWGLYAFTERVGIRRGDTLYASDQNSSEIFGLVETRKRTNESRQFIVSTAGVYEIILGAGNSIATTRYVGPIPGDIPTGAVVYRQRWGSDVYFVCGAGRPLKLTADGTLEETGFVERPRIWWSQHGLCDGNSADEDRDFYCHTYIDDDRDTSGEVQGATNTKSGDGAIFNDYAALHPQFPLTGNTTTEPDPQLQFPDPKGNGYSYSETYHAALCPKSQTVPSRKGQTWLPTPLYDMPEEERVRCVIFYFITGLNKNYDPPLETPRSSVFEWRRNYANTDDPDGTAYYVGFFTSWFAGEPVDQSYAKLFHSLTKSPSPDITHIRVYRTPRGGGDFYFEQEIPVPTGYGSDGQLFSFDIAMKPDSELTVPNTSLNNYAPPSGLKYIASYRGRMFYAGDPAFPYRLYYTPINKPYAVPPLYYKNLLGNITGLAPEKDRLVVTTEESIYEVNSADFDPSEVSEDLGVLQGSPVLAQEIKANSGCVAGRSLITIDDVGLVMATQRSIGLLNGPTLMPMSSHIEGFSDDDRPSSNEPTGTGYRMIYPQALNAEKASEWVGIYDRFNTCYMLFGSLYGEDEGNNVALIWYPYYTAEGLPREFSTLSLLSTDSPADASTGGIYVTDALEIKNPSTRKNEIWITAKNGYVYKLNSGRSDGVDYLCLEGTNYEQLTKKGNVASVNDSAISPKLNYTHALPWTSPGSSYEYTVRGRGPDYHVTDAYDLTAALSAYSITDPFVGSTITFTKSTTGNMYRRVVQSITYSQDASDDFYYLVPTLDFALDEIPDENWSFEFGNIYAERITGKGGLWDHNQITEVVDIDVLQKSQDHGLVESAYTPATIKAAYEALEGSTDDGYIIEGGALNPDFSGWARVEDNPGWNGNVANHPQGAPSSWTTKTISGTSYYSRTGNFSWYSGWPVVQAGAKGNPAVTIPNAWTDFEILLPADVYNGVTDPTYVAVCSKVEEFEPSYHPDHIDDFRQVWYDDRLPFYETAFLSNDIPVIILKNINSWFPDDTDCTGENNFISAHLRNYFDNGAEVVHAGMVSFQVLGYWTGFDVLKHQIARLGHMADVSTIQLLTYGQSARGNAARTLCMIHDKGVAALQSGAGLYDYRWYYQRDLPVAEGGMGSYVTSFLQNEAQKARTQAFIDFYNMGDYAGYWKRKQKKSFSLLQTSDGVLPINAGEWQSPYNTNQLSRNYIGTTVTKTLQSINVTNELGAGEIYDLPIEGHPWTELGFAGIFNKFPGNDTAIVPIQGKLIATDATEYTFTSDIGNQTGPYDQYFAWIKSDLGWGDEIVGIYVYLSGLICIDTGNFTIKTIRTLDYVNVTAYQLDDEHYPSDDNLQILAKNFTADVIDDEAKTAHQITGIFVSADRALQTLSVTVTFTGSLDTLRLFSLKDDPASFTGNYLFQESSDYNIQSQASPTSPHTFTVTYDNLSITNIDTDTDKLAFIAEGTDTTPYGSTERRESSRVYIINMNDQTEYAQAWSMGNNYIVDASYAVLNGYENDDFITETVKATTEHTKATGMRGQGRTFKWGIRQDGADDQIEIFGDVLITYTKPTFHTGEP